MEAELKRACEFEGTTLWGMNGGPPAALVDNEHIVFRDSINKLSAFRSVNVHTGKRKYGPIFAKESHCAESGWYPFSFFENFLDKNSGHPQIDRCGIYLLELAAGRKEDYFNHPVSKGRTESCFVEMGACWNK